MRNLFSFVGSHDPVTKSLPTGQDIDGPILTLAKQQHFDQIVLLATPAMEKSAENTAQMLRKKSRKSSVSIYSCMLADPTDHIEILHWQRRALKEYCTGDNEEENFAAIASGTPQMHACWLLLAGAGDAGLKLLQLRNPRYVTLEQPLVNVIDPMHPELPHVLADLDKWSSSNSSGNSQQKLYNAVGIAGNHHLLLKSLDRAVRAAKSDASILLLGETGTGKELMAKLIHLHSGRKGKLVPVHCGGLPDTLVESELFGHRKGAFTGATDSRKGFFEEADGGTLFLDEIGEMPLSLQVKLLRALNDKKIRPLGGEREIPVDVRIVAATNIDIQKAIREKMFRNDLYFRISTVVITLPPLRRKKSDIPILVASMMNEGNLAGKKQFTGKALRKLQSYSWPGNIRELRKVIESTLIMTDADVIDADDITFNESPENEETVCHLPEPHEGFNIKEYTAEINRRLKVRALEITGGNITKAARLLGITPAALSKELKEKGKDLK